MAGLHQLSRRKVESILKDNGFKKVRSGKHITYKKQLPKKRVLTTWVPHHTTVTVFVIKHIIKQTGIPKEEFY